MFLYNTIKPINLDVNVLLTEIDFAVNLCFYFVKRKKSPNFNNY